MSDKTKKIKKKKIIKLPRLRAKLLTLWSEAVREKTEFSCIYCGVKRGDINKNNPLLKVKIDAHHLLQKYIKNCPLKFEIKNGVPLCPSCHKFNGEHSFHKSPIVAYDWFRNKYPEIYDFILNNSSIRVDLENRLILEEIEKRLIAKESLDLEKLKQIEKDFPVIKKEKKIKTTTSTTTEATLFNLFQ